jgi:hypothetical protein
MHLRAAYRIAELLGVAALSLCVATATCYHIAYYNTFTLLYFNIIVNTIHTV